MKIVTAWQAIANDPLRILSMQATCCKFLICCLKLISLGKPCHTETVFKAKSSGVTLPLLSFSFIFVVGVESENQLLFNSEKFCPLLWGHVDCRVRFISAPSDRIEQNFLAIITFLASKERHWLLSILCKPYLTMDQTELLQADATS